MSADDIRLAERAAHVDRLRKLVAAGRYKVEPQKLALRILTRALRDRDE